MAGDMAGKRIKIKKRKKVNPVEKVHGTPRVVGTEVGQRQARKAKTAIEERRRKHRELLESMD